MKTVHLLPISLLLLCGVAHASDPVGVYAVVKGVTYEGDASAPSAVRICGAFALSNINNGSYFDPAAGYLYYNCRGGEEAMCRMQWKEIAGSAGKTCVAFGARRQGGGMENKNGTVRTELPPKGPDLYPIALGVVPMPMSAEGPTQCQTLAKVTVSTAACDGPVPPLDMRTEDTPDLTGTTADLRPVTPTPPAGGCALAGGGQGALGAAGLGLFLFLALVRRRRAARR